MKKLLRWLVPLVFLALGLYLLSLSYGAYAKWQEYLAIGDPSMVEAYEMEFWPEVSVGLLLILLGGFLLGRGTRR